MFQFKWLQQQKPILAAKLQKQGYPYIELR